MRGESKDRHPSRSPNGCPNFGNVSKPSSAGAAELCVCASIQMPENKSAKEPKEDHPNMHALNSTRPQPNAYYHSQFSLGPAALTTTISPPFDAIRLSKLSRGLSTRPKTQ